MADIEPGDEVFHRPCGETWVVLRAGADSAGAFVEPAGWPPERARAADCDLIAKGKHISLLGKHEPKAESTAAVAADRPFDLRAFSQENRARCEAANGFRHALDDWSEAEWMNAALGELGEAAGALKELHRQRDGVPGKGLTPEQIKQNIADEIADTVIYLDLLAQRIGVDLSTAIRSKFDRTSQKIGYRQEAAQ